LSGVDHRADRLNLPVEYVERQGVEDLAVPVAEDRARLAVHLAGLHRHVDPDEPGEDRGKHPGDIVGAHDRPGQLRGLAAAVRDDLNVSGEQLPQALDVAFPERAEEPLGEFLALPAVRLEPRAPCFRARRGACRVARPAGLAAGGLIALHGLAPTRIVSWPAARQRCDGGRPA